MTTPRTEGTAPAASIIVPTYRGAARLPLLLDALAAQQPGTPDFEIVLVIDGIDDGSVALAEAETRLTVRRILFPENRGRVAALNAGFDEAQGRVLIRCDDDLVPRPDYVAAHVAAHDGPESGAVGLYLNEHADTPYAAVYGRDADERFRRGAYAERAGRAWRYWAGNCSVTRETWEQVGPYDPDYRLYGWEDVDYGYRLHAAGIAVHLVEELETPHRVAAVTTAIRARRAAHSGAARRLFEAKHPAAGLPGAVPAWSVWNAAVRALSRVPIPPDRLGGAVDRVLAVLPAPVGRKLVALAVEASALAGYRRPQRVTEVF